MSHKTRTRETVAGPLPSGRRSHPRRGTSAGCRAVHGLVACFGATIVAGAASAQMPGTGTTAPVPETPITIVAERPHDVSSFTQGLVWFENTLYESAGGYGTSSLRAVDPVTGRVQRRVDLPRQLFAEGLARVGRRLFQLTWQEHAAIVWDLDTFQELERFYYQTEGWGLCYDGSLLVMSDGSSTLFFRRPDDFSVVRQVTVTRDGQSVSALNELECAVSKVFANVWQTDNILEIDPKTGTVERVFSARQLLTTAEASRADVLNGLAFDEATGRFFVTGKWWPKLFVAEFGEPRIGSPQGDTTATTKDTAGSGSGTAAGSGSATGSGTLTGDRGTTDGGRGPSAGSGSATGDQGPPPQSGPKGCRCDPTAPLGDGTGRAGLGLVALFGAWLRRRGRQPLRGSQLA